MPNRSLTERVEMLEHTVKALESLPARVTAVEAQLVQLRDEMRAGFSATRDELRAEMRAGDDGLRRDMQAMRQELVALIAEGDEETRRYMRVLHEEVIARLALIQEGRRPRRPGRG